jgi:hypothetical protein
MFSNRHRSRQSLRSRWSTKHSKEFIGKIDIDNWCRSRWDIFIMICKMTLEKRALNVVQQRQKYDGVAVYQGSQR